MACSMRLAFVISLGSVIGHASLGEAGSLCQHLAGAERAMSRSCSRDTYPLVRAVDPRGVAHLRGGGPSVRGGPKDLDGAGSGDGDRPASAVGVHHVTALRGGPPLEARTGGGNSARRLSAARVLAAAGFVPQFIPALLSGGARQRAGAAGVRASAEDPDSPPPAPVPPPASQKAAGGAVSTMAALRAGAANLVAKLAAGGALKAALLFLTAATLGPRSLPPLSQKGCGGSLPGLSLCYKGQVGLTTLWRSFAPFRVDVDGLVRETQKVNL